VPETSFVPFLKEEEPDTKKEIEQNKVLKEEEEMFQVKELLQEGVMSEDDDVLFFQLH
jgi:hypothetical protein